MSGSCDVAVIGAGPAGSTVANRLAAMGHDVVILEAQAFPRFHIGEALAHGVRQQLDFLGICEAIKIAAGQIHLAMDMAWSGSVYERQPAPPGGATVDRGMFDKALLEAAVRNGARLIQPAKARSVQPTGRGWSLDIEADEGHLELRTKFLIDAGGRRGFLGRSRRRTAPRLLAVHAYWEGSRLPTFPRIEAGEAHWLWASPTPLGFNVILFIDTASLRGQGSLCKQYARLVARSGILGEATGQAMSSKPVPCDASSYVDEAPVGTRYLKVGEAAFAIDPISSSGVQRAIQSGLMAAVVCNTLLRRPERSVEAQAFYAAETRSWFEQHGRWSSLAYADVRNDNAFWAARAGLVDPQSANQVEKPPHTFSGDDLLAKTPGVTISKAPVLMDDLVELRQVLYRPKLDRPVAFVGGIEIAPVFAHLLPRCTVLAAEVAIAEVIPAKLSRPILDWLVANQFLERRASSPGKD